MENQIDQIDMLENKFKGGEGGNLKGRKRGKPKYSKQNITA